MVQGENTTGKCSLFPLPGQARAPTRQRVHGLVRKYAEEDWDSVEDDRTARQCPRSCFSRFVGQTTCLGQNRHSQLILNFQTEVNESIAHFL